MAKKVKNEVKEILKGVTVSVVAMKKGHETKEKDMVYEETLKARIEFMRNGWRVDIYQIGFNK